MNEIFPSILNNVIVENNNQVVTNTREGIARIIEINGKSSVQTELDNTTRFNHTGKYNEEIDGYELEIITSKDYTNGNLLNENYETYIDSHYYIKKIPVVSNNKYTFKRSIANHGIAIFTYNQNSASGSGDVISQLYNNELVKTFAIPNNCNYITVRFTGIKSLDSYEYAYLQEGEEILVNNKMNKTIISFNKPLKSTPSGLADKIYEYNGSYKLLRQVGEKEGFNQKYEYTHQQSNLVKIENSKTNQSIIIHEIYGKTEKYNGILSCIKSVGKTYVDSEGNPILDEKNNKQYEIKLRVIDNLINIDEIEPGRLDNGILGYQTDSNLVKKKDSVTCTTTTAWRGFVTSFIEISGKQDLKASYVTDTNILSTVVYYDQNKSYISSQSNTGFLTVPDNAIYLRIAFVADIATTFTVFNITLYSKENYKNIILPSNLNYLSKGGWSYQDKLIWKDNKYIIDKRTQEITLKGNFQTDLDNNNYWIQYIAWNAEAHEGVNVHLTNMPSNISVIKRFDGAYFLRASKKDYPSLDELNALFNESNFTFICERSPLTLDTKVIEKISIPCTDQVSCLVTNEINYDKIDIQLQTPLVTEFPHIYEEEDAITDGFVTLYPLPKNEVKEEDIEMNGDIKFYGTDTTFKFNTHASNPKLILDNVPIDYAYNESIAIQKSENIYIDNNKIDSNEERNIDIISVDAQSYRNLLLDPIKEGQAVEPIDLQGEMIEIPESEYTVTAPIEEIQGNMLINVLKDKTNVINLKERHKEYESYIIDDYEEVLNLQYTQDENWIDGAFEGLWTGSSGDTSWTKLNEYIEISSVKTLQVLVNHNNQRAIEFSDVNKQFISSVLATNSIVTKPSNAMYARFAARKTSSSGGGNLEWLKIHLNKSTYTLNSSEKIVVEKIEGESVLNRKPIVICNNAENLCTSEFLLENNVLITDYIYINNPKQGAFICWQVFNADGTPIDTSVSGYDMKSLFYYEDMQFANGGNHINGSGNWTNAKAVYCRFELNGKQWTKGLNDYKISVRRSWDALNNAGYTEPQGIGKINFYENSLGELYKDDLGVPILSKDGKKQFKIDIVLDNKNLFKHSNIVWNGATSTIINDKTVYFPSVNWGSTNVNTRMRIYGDFKPNSQYIITFKQCDEDGQTTTLPLSSHVRYKDGTNKSLNNIPTSAEKEVDYFYFNSGVYVGIYDIQIEKSSSSTEYEENESKIESVIIPQQLRSSWNGYREILFYDNDQYKISTRFKEVEVNLKSINVGSNLRFPNGDTTYHYCYRILSSSATSSLSFDTEGIECLYSDIFDGKASYYDIYWGTGDLTNKEFSKFNYLTISSKNIVIRLSKSAFYNEQTANAFLDEIAEQTIKLTAIYNESKTQIIETGISKKIEMSTWDNGMRIYTSGNGDNDEDNTIKNNKLKGKLFCTNPVTTIQTIADRSKNYSLFFDSDENTEVRYVIGKDKENILYSKKDEFNILNFNDVDVVNGYLDVNTGTLIGSDNYNTTSEFFKVSSNINIDIKYISIAGESYIYFFDKNKNFISSVTFSSDKTIRTPMGCYYLKTSRWVYCNYTISVSDKIKNTNCYELLTSSSMPNSNLTLKGKGQIRNLMLIEGTHANSNIPNDHIEDVICVGDYDEVTGKYKIKIHCEEIIEKQEMPEWRQVDYRFKNFRISRFINKYSLALHVIISSKDGVWLRNESVSVGKEYIANSSEIITGLCFYERNGWNSSNMPSIEEVIEYLDSNNWMSSSITILLNEPLRKMGAVKDTLFWNEERKKICIRRRIGKAILNGQPNEMISHYAMGRHPNWVNPKMYSTQVTLKTIAKDYSFAIASKDLGKCWGEQDLTATNYREGYESLWTQNYFYLNIEKNRIVNPTTDSWRDVVDYLKENPMEVYYCIADKIEETDISNPLELELVKNNKNIISSRNQLKPYIWILRNTIKSKCLIKPSTTYNLSLNSENDLTIKLGNQLITYLSTDNQKKITTPSTLSDTTISFVGRGFVRNVMLREDDRLDLNYFEKMQFTGEINSSNKYEINLVSKDMSGIIDNIKIELDEPLRKLSNNVYDSIENGYLVRRIKAKKYDESMTVTVDTTYNTSYTYGFTIAHNLIDYKTDYIVNSDYLLERKSGYDTWSMPFITGSKNLFIINIPKSDLSEQSVEEAKRWLLNRNVEFYYEIAEPITTSLDVNEHDFNAKNAQIITSNNLIKPILKVELPYKNVRKLKTPTNICFDSNSENDSHTFTWNTDKGVEGHRFYYNEQLIQDIKSPTPEYTYPEELKGKVKIVAYNYLGSSDDATKDVITVPNRSEIAELNTVYDNGYLFNIFFNDNSEIKKGYKFIYSVDDGEETEIDIPIQDKAKMLLQQVNLPAIKVDEVKSHMTVMVNPYNEAGEAIMKPKIFYLTPTPKWTYIAASDKLMFRLKNEHDFYANYKFNYKNNNSPNEEFKSEMFGNNQGTPGLLMDYFHNTNPEEELLVSVTLNDETVDHIPCVPFVVSKALDLSLIAPSNFTMEWLEQGVAKFSWDDIYTNEDYFEFSYSLNGGLEQHLRIEPTDVESNNNRMSYVYRFAEHGILTAKVRMVWELNASEYTPSKTATFVEVTGLPPSWIVKKYDGNNLVISWEAQSYVDYYEVILEAEGKEEELRLTADMFNLDLTKYHGKYVSIKIKTHFTTGVVTEYSDSILFKPISYSGLLNEINGKTTICSKNNNVSIYTKTNTRFTSYQRISGSVINENKLFMKSIKERLRSELPIRNTICHLVNEYYNNLMSTSTLDVRNHSKFNVITYSPISKDGLLKSSIYTPTSIAYKDFMDITRVMIICLGDSITAGHPGFWAESMTGEIEHQYPYWLDRRLKFKYDVINKGYGSDRTFNLLDRIHKDVVDLKPHYCIIQIGTNDIYWGAAAANGDKDVFETTLNDMKNNMRELVNICLENNIKPVVGTLIPRTQSVTDPLVKYGLYEFNDWIRQWANTTEGLNYVDFFHAGKNSVPPTPLEDPNSPGAMNPIYDGDNIYDEQGVLVQPGAGIHLNKEGYRIMAEEIPLSLFQDYTNGLKLYMDADCTIEAEYDEQDKQNPFYIINVDGMNLTREKKIVRYIKNIGTSTALFSVYPTKSYNLEYKFKTGDEDTGEAAYGIIMPNRVIPIHISLTPGIEDFKSEFELALVSREYNILN